MSLEDAKGHFRAAMASLTKGMEELDKLKVVKAGAAPAATAPTPEPASAPPRRPKTGVTMPASALPKLETKGPKELSEETREKSVSDGTEIARRVASVVGGVGGHFDDALRGQLALHHIPFDGEVLKRLKAVAS